MSAAAASQADAATGRTGGPDVTSGRDAAVLGVAVASALAVGAAAPPALSPAAGYALGVTVFAAILWLTGAVPLSLTALATPVLLVAFGVAPTFGDAVTGFVCHVLLRVGTSPRRLVLALMVATALLSMLVSNTATTAMMVPIAVGLVGEVIEVVSADADADDAGEA